MGENNPMRRVHAHLERAERAGARSETAATEAELRRAAGKQSLHTLAAADALMVAAGKETKAEQRARRRRRK
jgi:hypothetical protein